MTMVMRRLITPQNNRSFKSRHYENRVKYFWLFTYTPIFLRTTVLNLVQLKQLSKLSGVLGHSTSHSLVSNIPLLVLVFQKKEGFKTTADSEFGSAITLLSFPNLILPFTLCPHSKHLLSGHACNMNPALVPLPSPHHSPGDTQSCFRLFCHHFNKFFLFFFLKDFIYLRESMYKQGRQEGRGRETGKSTLPS